MQVREHVHGKFHILPLQSKCLEIKNISCNRYKPKQCINTWQNIEVSNSAKATCWLIAVSKNLQQHKRSMKWPFPRFFPSGWTKISYQKYAVPACCKKYSSKTLTSKQYLPFALTAASHWLIKIYPLAIQLHHVKPRVLNLPALDKHRKRRSPSTPKITNIT